MTEILTYLIIFLFSYTGVGLLRRWVVRKEILDIPNERSSHSVPTPRGGGLIIVLVSLAFYVAGSFFLPINFHRSFFIGAFLIALISWLDDLFSISFGWRFLVHSLAAILVISDLGFWQEIYLPFYGSLPTPGLLGAILTFCWIVWLTNAFNFMDGIDGIAGLQAVTAGIGWLVVGKMLGAEDAAIFGAVLAFSSLGFLLHNWQPAKIFMGDVGSAFLGYGFAVLPLLPEKNANSNLLPVIAFVLVFCFVFDSVLTFLKRLLKKEKVWEAHREHIYQKLVIRGYSHQFVTSLYGALSIIIGGVLIFWLS